MGRRPRIVHILLINEEILVCLWDLPINLGRGGFSQPFPDDCNHQWKFCFEAWYNSSFLIIHLLCFIRSCRGPSSLKGCNHTITTTKLKCIQLNAFFSSTWFLIDSSSRIGHDVFLLISVKWLALPSFLLPPFLHFFGANPTAVWGSIKEILQVCLNFLQDWLVFELFHLWNTFRRKEKSGQV